MTQSEALEREVSALPEIYSGVSTSSEWESNEALRREIERLREAKEEAVSAQQRLAFLCDVSRELATSLDRSQTLEKIARITVPVMADACVVLVAGEVEGRFEIGAVRCDPSRDRALRELLSTYVEGRIREPEARGESAIENPVVTVMSTGAPILVTNISDAYLRAVASSAEELRLSRELDMGSFVMVPLKVGGHILGVLALATTRRRNAFEVDDVHLVEEVARRAASALENAHLLRAEQRARAAAEKAAEALRVSDERYRLAERASDAYLYFVDFMTGETAFSSGVERVFGWAHASAPMDYEAAFVWWLERVHPLERDQVSRDYISGLAGTGEAWNKEYRFLRGDGQYAWVLDRAAFKRNERGEPVQVIGSVIDISDRMRALETQRRLAALVEASDEGILSVTREGLIESWNKGAARIFGYRAEEVLGKSVLILTPPERMTESRRLLERCLSGEAVIGVETVCRMKCDRHIEISLSISPIRDAAGDLVGLSALLQDITERKRLRAQLALADRTASLGTFAAGVAHEVNNPIAYVVANLTRMVSDLERLRKGSAVSPEVAPAIEALSQAALDAKDGASRIAQIIRDLQTLSRGDEDTRRPADLRSIIDIAVKMAGAQAHGRAEIVKEYGEVPLVEANEALLVQVFINLVVNAAHAIPEGAERHEIRVVTSKDPEGRAVAEVRDTGMGIPPEILERIFEPFFTTKPVGVGTGIGLAICRGIVSAHGGSIEVLSELGKGSVFRVTLPSLAPRAAQPEERATPAAVGAPRRGKLLVIDDEVKLGKAITLELSSDHDAELVTSGNEALARFHRGERFDVILCDLFMPTVPGAVLFEEIRRIDPAQAERVIFLTGGAFTPGARKFLSEIKNRSLEKPFDMDRLRAIVREAMPG